ncbi:MAG: amidohydrolase family protein, partial [Myxococcales bacterium]|nr:amidohydrolase family protein [Myxococcales bacterium]
MSDLVISAPFVITHDDELGVIEDGAVLVHDREIAAVGPRETIRAASSAKEIAYPDGVIMPGLINAHTHLYSAFARGISIPGPAPKSFPEILELLWWRLDRTLQAEDIYYSALLGVLDAARWGVTTLIDHHASPNAVDGSLDWIARAFEAVGLRGILCYEVSDRDGLEIAARGRAENERFIERITAEGHRRLRAAYGLHAAFTVGEETLAAASDAARRLGVGVHIHVAEDPCDVTHGHQTHQQG